MKQGRGNSKSKSSVTRVGEKRVPGEKNKRPSGGEGRLLRRENVDPLRRKKNKGRNDIRGEKRETGGLRRDGERPAYS